MERLEEHHGHKEPASFENATIEHIMPQTLSPAWRKLLGDEVERIHEHWCDCFANLTLTAYNPTLSNSPFSVKRDIYADSNYSLTKNLAKKHHWGLEELEERNEELFQRARKIWPRD